MFKRKPRSYAQMASDMVWPRGGWSRSAQYVVHRVRRLPDEPHRVARGFGIGVFVNFTPLFGFHLMLAMGMAWIMRANMLAAVLGTFVGNPLTTPLIAVLSVSLGRRMLGVHGSASPGAILKEFTSAGRSCGRTSSPSSRTRRRNGTGWARSSTASFCPIWWAGCCRGSCWASSPTT